MLIDIGVNLTNKRFDKDRDELILRAKNQGVEKLLITGTNVYESQQALALCQHYQQKFPNTLFSTAGVHPHDADGVGDDYLEQLIQLTKQPHVKAIGECGLDFNRNFSAPEQQLKVFKVQIRSGYAIISASARCIFSLVRGTKTFYFSNSCYGSPLFYR